MNYFGTNLDTAGHFFWELEGDVMRSRDLNFKDFNFDPEQLPIPRTPLRKGSVFFFKIDGYSILRIEGSCKDDRWGTKSVFFVKEDINKEELVEKIKSIPIAMKIINQMPFEVQDFKQLVNI